jgi:hypothetical protein
MRERFRYIESLEATQEARGLASTLNSERSTLNLTREVIVRRGELIPSTLSSRRSVESVIRGLGVSQLSTTSPQ